MNDSPHILPDDHDSGVAGKKNHVGRIFLLLCCLGVLCYVAMQWRSQQPVAEIAVSGAVALSNDEVLQGLDSSLRIKPVDEIQLISVKAAIEKNPLVQHATVERHGVRGIEVSVKERQPVAALVGANGEILFIDHEGVQLPYSRFLNRADVPLLHGVIANGKIDTASLKVSAEILKNLRSLPEKTLLKTISEVHFNRLTRAFSVVSDAGVEIFLGNETLLPASLQKLNDLWQSQAIDKKTLNELEYIDLRWQGKVITRSRNA